MGTYKVSKGFHTVYVTDVEADTPEDAIRIAKSNSACWKHAGDDEEIFYQIEEWPEEVDNGPRS